MRVAMIHAVAGSIHPTQMAFRDEFPDAELVNVMDDSLLADYGDNITAKLRRRMSQLICYCADHGADAVGLACSVYAPVVESARDLVDIPVLSSYEAVIDDAVSYGSRIGIIASVRQPCEIRNTTFGKPLNKGVLRWSRIPCWTSI